MKKWAQKQTGFTIVELLIVVVVIAILAAITIVAYNGIQNQAKESALRSDVANAKKSMEVFKATRDRYPTSSVEAALKASGGVTSVYTPINAGGGYCAQFTNGSFSYFVSNVSEQKAGVCASVTNLATNPSLESSGTNWGARWYGSGGSGTNTPQSPNAALCGSVGYRKLWTVSGSGFQDLGVTYSHAGPTVGQSYDFVISMRASFATTYRLWVEWRDSANTVVARTESVVTQAPNANTWYTMKTSGVAAVGSTSAVVIASPYPSGGSDTGFGATIPVGATLDADCVMVSNSVSGYQPDYADGSMTNWTWTGTPHASTSTGVGY